MNNRMSIANLLEHMESAENIGDFFEKIEADTAGLIEDEESPKETTEVSTWATVDKGILRQMNRLLATPITASKADNLKILAETRALILQYKA